MTDEEIRDYAATLLLDHARNVEFLTIHEMAEDNVEGGEISDEDALKVDTLIREATVAVSFPGVDLEYTDAGIDAEDDDDAPIDPRDELPEDGGIAV